MLCFHMGRVESKTHYPTFPDMDSFKDRPINISECTVIKMVDPIGKIRLEICG